MFSCLSPLPQVERRKAELLELMAEAGLKPKGHVHCWQYGAWAREARCTRCKGVPHSAPSMRPSLPRC